jgi:hypothetical protein
MMREFAADDSRNQVIGSLAIGRQQNRRRIDDLGKSLVEHEK